jgi:hypothetical protein
MDHAPIIVTAVMGSADQAWANALRQQYFPPERNFLDAHITLFHHLPPLHLPEIKARLKDMTAQYAPPSARLTDVLLFGRGVAYRVDCPDLLIMRDELAHALHGLIVPQDQARPRLHITIQNKVESSEAKALYAELAADFKDRPIEIKGLAAHYYRGGPWEPIMTSNFRG